jgi:hypothetical protein
MKSQIADPCNAVFLRQTFYMPTKSDEGVRAFRQWISKFGGKAPAWAVSLLS